MFNTSALSAFPHASTRRARQALNLLLVPPAAGHKAESLTTAVKFFDQLEIYPGAFFSAYLSEYAALSVYQRI